MAHTIKPAIGTVGQVFPFAILDYARTRASSNQATPTLDGSLFITQRPLQRRSGTLRCMFTTSTQAAACEALLATPGVFQLLTDDANIAMRFSVSDQGVQTRQAVTGTPAAWEVSIGYWEVIL